MSQVIGAKLHLKAVSRLAIRQRHHPGIVDQQIQVGIFSLHRLAKRPHRSQIGQIKRAQNQLCLRSDLPDLRGGLLTFGQIAAGHNDPRPFLRQRQRSLVPQSTIGAGHNGRFPVQIRHICRGPFILLRHRYIP